MVSCTKHPNASGSSSEGETSMGGFGVSAPRSKSCTKALGKLHETTKKLVQQMRRFKES